MVRDPVALPFFPLIVTALLLRIDILSDAVNQVLVNALWILTTAVVVGSVGDFARAGDPLRKHPCATLRLRLTIGLRQIFGSQSLRALAGRSSDIELKMTADVAALKTRRT